MSHTFILPFHILMGAIAIASGLFAMSMRKGASKHMGAGKLFLASMLLMCLSGGLLSALKGITLSLLVSVFTIYLVATAWRASARFKQQATWADVFGLVIITSLAVAFLYHGWLAQISPEGYIDGIKIGKEAYYFFGLICLVAAAGDLRFILNNRRAYQRALPAHVWRISLSLFIATGSFFTGNPQVFTDALNESGVLAIPERVVLLVMVYYLVRLFLQRNGVSFSALKASIKRDWSEPKQLA